MRKDLPISYATVSVILVIAVLLIVSIAAYFNSQTGSETVKLLKAHSVSWEALRGSRA